MKFLKGHIGYWKNKKLSLGTRQKMSLAHKGITPKSCFKKGYIPWNKGIHTGVKLSLSKKHSNETKIKMSNSHKEYYKNHFHCMKDKNISEDIKLKISNSLKGRIGYWKGKKFSKETCLKISLANKGKLAHNIMHGKDNPAWRGGITKLPNYVSLKTKRRKYYKKLGGFLSIQTIQQVYEDNIKKYGTLTCYLCLKSIDFGQDSLEHKQPLARGGTNLRNNLDVAHRSCNSKKGTKTFLEYCNK